MKLLAIETSTQHATIALQVNQQQEQIVLGSPYQQIEQILPTIDQLLKQAAISVKELAGLVLSAGPGSFTGLRVALGVLQGFSLAYDIPVAAVSSLQVLAQTAFRQRGYQYVACATNAFMQEIYYGLYQFDKIMQPIQADSLVTPQNISLPTQSYYAVGDAWQIYAEQFPENKSFVTNQDVIYPEAIDALSLANHSAKWQAIDTVDLNYLRKKEAWKILDKSATEA